MIPIEIISYLIVLLIKKKNNIMKDKKYRFKLAVFVFIICVIGCFIHSIEAKKPSLFAYYLITTLATTSVFGIGCLVDFETD